VSGAGRLGAADDGHSCVLDAEGSKAGDGMERECVLDTANLCLHQAEWRRGVGLTAAELVLEVCGPLIDSRVITRAPRQSMFQVGVIVSNLDRRARVE
jgi:hypothetical protein